MHASQHKATQAVSPESVGRSEKAGEVGKHVAESFSTTHTVTHQKKGLALDFRQRGHMKDKIVDIGYYK